MDIYEDLDAYLYHRHYTGPADHPRAAEHAADAGEHAMQHRALRSSPETFADPVTLADDVELSVEYMTDICARVYAMTKGDKTVADELDSLQAELRNVAAMVRLAGHDTTMTARVEGGSEPPSELMDVA